MDVTLPTGGGWMMMMRRRRKLIALFKIFIHGSLFHGCSK
jgi:hypothetical protein